MRLFSIYELRIAESPKGKPPQCQVAVRPQWRGARRIIETEDPARARPAEGGKPGLSGLDCALLRLTAFAYRNRCAGYMRRPARDGGFGARSRKMGGFDSEVGLQKKSNLMSDALAQPAKRGLCYAQIRCYVLQGYVLQQIGLGG